MGTLFSQPPRKHFNVSEDNLESCITHFIELSKKHKITVDQVIAIAQLLEDKRRNNIRIANGDIHDEQMTGFGDLLQNFIDVTRRIADGIEEMKQNELD